MSHLWGDEDPLHVQDEPNCPTCGNPMSRHWLSRLNWECEDCEAEETNNEANQHEIEN
jgi:ribosomal protein L37AE/L43A